MAKHSVDSRHNIVAAAVVATGLVIKGVLGFIPNKRIADCAQASEDRAARDDDRAEKARKKEKAAKAKAKREKLKAEKAAKKLAQAAKAANGGKTPKTT